MTPEQELELIRIRARARARAQQEQEARSRATAPQGRAEPNQAQREEVARYASERHYRRNLMPGIGHVAQPLVNLATDPARRRELMNSAQGAWRDLQQVPSLDLGRLARDTLNAGGEAVRNLPELAGQVVRNLPQIARGVTYGPFVDEEQAQRRLDLARVMGDEQGVSAAAREANAQTGNLATNVAGVGAGALVRTPLQAAGAAVALDAPHAVSRGEGALQERLPQALTEIGGAAAFGGTAQYGANRLSRLLSAPPRTGRMVERMERAGVDPSLAAANGGGLSGAVTQMVGDNLAAGPVVRHRIRRQLTQARDASGRIASGYAPPRPLEGAGGMIQRGVERFARDRAIPNPQPQVDPARVSTREWSFASKADAVFDVALEPVLDNPAPLSRTTQVLDELAQRADAPLVRRFQADPVLTSFERAVRRLQRGAADSFEPATADDLAAMVAEIEHARRAVGTREQSLATWTRRQGGIRDDRGDIFGLDPAGRGASAMLSRNGRTIDDLAVNAWEDGFFPGAEPPTARQFLDALERDLRSPGSVERSYADAGAASNAREVLRYYEQQGVDTSLRGQALQRALRPLIGVDEGTGGQAPTLRDLRELRRRIREAQARSPALGQTVDNAALQRLEQALTDDIYAAAGDAAPNLQAADRFYRRGRQRIDSVLNEFAQGDPGQAIPRILRLARPNGDSRAIATLRNALRDDEWRIVAASIIDHLGQPTPGASGFNAQLGFSIQNFATRYRAMSPQARRVIFGGGGFARGPAARQLNQLADELDNLAQVALSLKGVENMANFSGSATHLQNLATGSLAVTNLPATLSLIAGLGLLGEVLTNPAAVRWLTSAPRGGAGARGMRRWVGDLGQLAARDPALIPVYHELAAQLPPQAPESGRPAYAPPRPQSQLRPVP